MKDTRNEIIAIANDLIRSIGYNAFSYADISKELNIKNAAIHYYFPTKGDLGAEVIRKNLSLFREKTESWKELPYRQQLNNYLTMHDGFIADYRACIVGSLAPAFDTLPENMQHAVQRLVHVIIDWLSDILSKGKETGEFTFDGSPRTKAYIVHSAMLSALLMNKVLRNEVYRSVQADLLSI
jgi:Transcriptional regulator